MVCLVVSCQGWGDVWSHDTRAEAWVHPLTQFGDAIMEGPQDVLSEYNAYEWPSLADKLGVSLSQLDLTLLRSGLMRDSRAARERTADQMWSALLDAASPTLTDSAAICEQVSRDRRRATMAKKEPAPKPVAEAKAPAEKTPGAPRGTPGDAIITMQADKNGKKYGVDNNPKKAGSKGAERFALYVDGMTVDAALKAGIWAADISWDVNKGFVVVSGGTPKATKAPKAAAEPASTETSEVDATEAAAA